MNTISKVFSKIKEFIKKSKWFLIVSLSILAISLSLVLATSCHDNRIQSDTSEPYETLVSNLRNKIAKNRVEYIESIKDQEEKIKTLNGELNSMNSEIIQKEKEIESIRKKYPNTFQSTPTVSKDDCDERLEGCKLELNLMREVNVGLKENNLNLTSKNESNEVIKKNQKGIISGYETDLELCQATILSKGKEIESLKLEIKSQKNKSFWKPAKWAVITGVAVGLIFKLKGVK